MQIENKVLAAFCVLVGTSASFTFIACGEAPEPEGYSGPVAFQETGVGFLALPDGCLVPEPADQAEPAGSAIEISCELLETTDNPAGPAGTVHVEVSERREGHIELAEVSALEAIRLEQEPLYEALPGGEFKGVGGMLAYGPFGATRYSRGHYQAADGSTLQQIRLFMVHPNDNRILSIVYNHPFVDNADTTTRINNHLLVLLEQVRGANEVQAEIDARGGAAEGADTDGGEADESAAGETSTY